MRYFGRVVAVMVASAMAASCASAPIKPSPTQPYAACVVTCRNGYMSRIQHICRGGPRWFKDVWLIGEYISRGADGVPLINTWVGKDGDYDKQDVELGSCSTVINRIIQGRSAEQRGQDPGTDPQGRPNPRD